MAKQSFAQHLKAAESLARLTGLTQRHISAIEKQSETRRGTVKLIEACGGRISRFKNARQRTLDGAIDLWCDTGVFQDSPTDHGRRAMRQSTAVSLTFHCEAFHALTSKRIPG